MKSRLLCGCVLGIVALVVPAAAAEPTQQSPELEPPFKINAGEQPLDVGRSGHAAPYFADFDGDGRRDLLVGQYDEGRLRLYRNEGTNKAPRFGSFDYVMADDRPASVPVFCCIGFTPQLVDLDRDGLVDLLSGSAPGEIYLFRRRSDGTFAAGEKLCDSSGKEITPGSIATAYAVDWDGDQRLDLVLGNVSGDVHVARNVSNDGKLLFDPPTKVDLDDPREHKRDNGPVAADWDGDGRLDLISGDEDGSVYWFRNTGEVHKPKFARGECLVPVSPLTTRDDNSRGPHECGQRSKVCVADYNDDGRLDLLVGDMAGFFRAKPEQTAAEVREEQEALASLPELRQEWVKSFAAFRKLAAADTKAEERSKLLERVTALKAKIDQAESIVKRYEEQQQTHGYVWVFLRKPAAATKAQLSLTTSSDQEVRP